MKIGFFFNSGTKGFGGHHISSKALIDGLRALGHNCCAMSFGSVSSKVFKDCEFYQNINISPYNLKQRCALKEILHKSEFDAIFPIDEISCRIILSVYPRLLSKMIPIKPGWINVSSWVNLTHDFICFSQENYDYMKHLKKYSNTALHLIPNRVYRVIPKGERINDFRMLYNIKDDDIIIFAVARIDPDKMRVFQSAINLAKKIKQKNIDSRLFIIGSVSSENSFEQLKCLVDDIREVVKVNIITEEKFTNKVSEIFPVAQYLVGMGRTVMEALSLQIPSFVPNDESELPILVESNVIQPLMASNLTYRARLLESEINQNINCIDNLMTDYLKYSKESSELFEKYFDVEMGLPRYIAISEAQRNHKRNLIKEIRAWTYSNIRWIGCSLLK